MLMNTFVLVFGICLCLYFFLSRSVEKLENLKEQRYLSFLDNVNENFKSKSPKTGPFRGSCDDKINTMVQLKALNEEYSRSAQTLGTAQNIGTPQSGSHQDPCVSVSQYLCEFTHPNMYLSETQMAPKWLMKSLKNKPPPTHINLSCFATNYDCCKQSLKSKPS